MKTLTAKGPEGVSPASEIVGSYEKRDRVPEATGFLNRRG
jgi:hypothetical protein